jgi:hypothetical protein
MSGGIHIGPGSYVGMGSFKYARIAHFLRPRISTFSKDELDKIFFLDEVCGANGADFSKLNTIRFRFCYEQLRELYEGLQMLTEDEKADVGLVKSHLAVWDEIRTKWLADPRMTVGLPIP